jgi:hypothetical protein
MTTNLLGYAYRRRLGTHPIWQQVEPGCTDHRLTGWTGKLVSECALLPSQVAAADFFHLLSQREQAGIQMECHQIFICMPIPCSASHFRCRAAVMPLALTRPAEARRDDEPWSESLFLPLVYRLQ